MPACFCERCVRKSIRSIGLVLDVQRTSTGVVARLNGHEPGRWGPAQHSPREAALGVLARDPRGALLLWPSPPGET